MIVATADGVEGARGGLTSVCEEIRGKPTFVLTPFCWRILWDGPVGLTGVEMCTVLGDRSKGLPWVRGAFEVSDPLTTPETAA